MSPRRANSLTAKVSLIRTLAPGLMKAYGVTFEQAKEILAAMTEDERYFLFTLKARCTGKRTVCNIVKRKRLTRPRTEAQNKATLALVAYAQQHRASR